MKNDQDELKKIFNETYAQTMKDNQNIKSFIQILDDRINKLLDEREETIRMPFERMIN